MILPLFISYIIEILASILVIILTLYAVIGTLKIKSQHPEVVFYRYLYYQSIALFVFASGRAVGHLVKRFLILTDNSALWEMLSPFSGAINTLTFIIFAGLALMYPNIRDMNRQIYDLESATKRYQQLYHYKTVIFDSLFPALVIAKDYTVVDVNEPFLRTFQKPRGDVIKKKCYELTHHSNIPCKETAHICPLQDVFVSGENAAVIHNHTTPSGERIYELNFSPVINEDGIVTSVIEVYRDITRDVMAEQEKERLRKQFFQAQKSAALKTLVGGIAHEFNNILAGIQGNAELLLLTPYEPEKSKERIKKILLSTEKAAELVYKMLRYQHTMVLNKKRFNLTEFMEDIIKIVHSSLPENISIKYLYSEEDLTLEGDPSALTETILNICQNARDAMPDGGVLTIITKRVIYENKRWIVIEIIDTGVGIKSKDLERIFDPFFTTKKVGEGTGMGLSVVKGIVEAHDGMVMVESKEGEGSKFTIYLPALPHSLTDTGQMVSS